MAQKKFWLTAWELLPLEGYMMKAFIVLGIREVFL